MWQFLRAFLIFFISLILGLSPVHRFANRLEYVLDMRNKTVEILARDHVYPDTQYGVMALGISAFASTFTLTSTINGYRVLEDTATHITVWVDEALTIHWKTDSKLGNVDIITFEKKGNDLVLSNLSWWADLREYLYERNDIPAGFNKYLDLPRWNKRWVPYLLMTPSVMLTATKMNDATCTPPETFTPSIAVRWMLTHTYPIGSFKVPMLYSTHFKYFPGDDCANSVSQALYCGGLKTDDKWRPYEAAWIYVPKFWEYIIHHGWRKVPCKEALPGDVLLFDVNRSGTPEHATLITGRVEGRPLYTAHTSHKWNMPVPLGDHGMWRCYRYMGR